MSYFCLLIINACLLVLKLQISKSLTKVFFPQSTYEETKAQKWNETNMRSPRRQVHHPLGHTVYCVQVASKFIVADALFLIINTNGWTIFMQGISPALLRYGRGELVI